MQGSTALASAEKPEAGLDGCQALSKYMARNHPGATVEEMFACHYRVRYPIQGIPYPALTSSCQPGAKWIYQVGIEARDGVRSSAVGDGALATVYITARAVSAVTDPDASVVNLICGARICQKYAGTRLSI